ncbi:dihydrolipoyl dehydrogenase [Nitrososphaera sp.]|uniref:dihydrolipoyl dehydrogenase n=1 Tax=Nitrososphaera sp. TaxID=1971748 RepID=UPI0017C3A8C7|nr:dihydrolipoyl dehydrogenase [Nitrososphaera sp.]NWG37934.1 dihydrolipoyl dehydrogenase [Nitrososphaera sp.]
MEKFDLIVIGSGSGLDVANAAAQGGMKVAIIEKDRMGGTCLNRGCIPSKLLLHSADVMEAIKGAGTFGIEVAGVKVDFEKIVRRTNGIIDPDSEGIRRAFESIDNPMLFHAECKFVGKKEIAVAGRTITADKILIASGTRPGVPKVEGLEGSGFITTDEALRLEKQPRVLTIIGGGYIACELGHFFGALGTKVNIVQRRDVILVDEDEEVAKRFTEVFSKKHSVYTGFTPMSVAKKDGSFVVSAKNRQGEEVKIESDQLLVAAGRVPNSDMLDLEKTGVRTDKAGFIQVDEYLETSVKGIFALGDAIGRYLFKHSANHEAQYAYNNIARQKKIAVDYTAMPHAVFASPQVAGVGQTEQELREKGVHYAKAVYPYINTAMGEALEDRDGFVKLLVGHDRKILGCHIIGTDASVLIHEVLVVMKMGGTVDHIANTVHIHPALSEVVARASYSV